MLLDNVSQSRKGTCFFPSLDVRIAHQRIPNYPASNAYDISPTLHAKKDFSLGYSSMFHPPFARKIAKKTGPAPNQYNIAVDLCKQNYSAKSVFSSRTKRTISCSSKERGPSPCHYRIKDSLIRASPPVLVSCFRSKTGRTTDPETLSPGPAAYQQPRKCILNFSAPAVPPPQDPPLPGPGQYDIVDYTAPSKHYISSAVFVSNTKRWTGEKLHKGIPGPGENITVIKCPYSRPDSHPFEKKNESEAQKRPASWLERPRASEKERAYNIPISRKQSFMYNVSNKWVPVL
ncbi:hypothetical protein L345_08338, partial [Ophiophagus hannah]